MKIPYLRFILNLFIKGGRLRKKRLGVTIKKSNCLFISWKKYSQSHTQKLPIRLPENRQHAGEHGWI